ncbi:MAG: efflux RND transporter permease subunit, partial [Spirochaetia bacterium]|nr:efflux RND transporter permease subunit [Spirochaetia bacterium]
MDNNLRNFRLKLIFLALCILILLAVKGHIKLGYAPELERKSIAVAFDYYGAFEKEIEILVSHLEEAYMEVRGIRDIYSVSEPGRGYILCQFSEQIRLDEAYVQISDITAYVYADFPEGVNRPVITRSASDSYPVYISWFPIKRESDAAYIREAYEAVPGAGEVELGGRKKKELMVELHTGRLTGMALSSDVLGSRLRSSNL